MSETRLQAEARTQFGKGAARRIRREDKIPAVIYGHGNEPVHVILPGHQTMMALKHGGANALLALDIDGTEQLALTKDVQVDPIRRVIEHLDFVAVKRGEKVTVDVPIHVVGDAAPDTLVVTENAVVSVEAEATHIPEFFEVSVEGAPSGTQVLAKDLDLPKGTTLLADELARRMGSSFRSHKTGRADVVEGRLGLGGPRVVLARARGYMNELGGPVKALATFYKVQPDHVIAIHDELDIAFGTLRIKLGGGDNGHNGLKSMRSSLGTGDFYRVRAGIGRPPGRQDVADFVLSNYSTVERKELPFQVSDAADAVESLITDGLEKTQQRFNS